MSIRDRYPLPSGFDTKWAKLRLSPCGARSQLTFRNEDGHHETWIDGERRAITEWARGKSPAMRASADLSQHAWSEAEGGESFVVHDGCRFGPFDEVRLPLDGTFSVDNTLHFAFRRERAWWALVGDREYGPFTDRPIVSAARGQAMIIARRADGAVLVAGDETHGPFDWLGGASRLDDGRLAYCFERAGDYVVRVGEGELGPITGTRPMFCVHPGTGAVLLAQQRPDGREVLTRDGQEVADVGQLRAFGPELLSPDGERTSLCFDDEGGAGYDLDDERHDGFAYTDGPWWSADGNHHAVCASSGDDDTDLLIVDGAAQALPHRIDYERGGCFGFTSAGEFCLVMREPTQGADVVQVGARRYGPLWLEKNGAGGSELSRSPSGEVAFVHRPMSGSGRFVTHGDAQLGPFELAACTFDDAGELVVASVDTTRGEWIVQTQRSQQG